MNNVHTQHNRVLIYCLLNYLCYSAAKTSFHVIMHQQLMGKEVDNTQIFSWSLKRFLLDHHLDSVLHRLKLGLYDEIEPDIITYIRELYNEYINLCDESDYNMRYKKYLFAVRGGWIDAQESSKLSDLLIDNDECGECDRVLNVMIQWNTTSPMTEDAALMAKYIENLNQFAVAIPGVEPRT